MRGKLVIGNWKMNGRWAANATLLDALRAGWKTVPGRRLAVCVPFPYLGQTRDLLAGSEIAWGGQDVSAQPAGAFTGDVAAGMLADFGCRYVLVGHSERRQIHRETNETVAAKAVAAVKSGLTPVVCVGETLAERDAGQMEAVVGQQFDVAAAALGVDLAKAVVAYEPVWAIGTGRTASPAQAQAMHAFIRARLVAGGAPDVSALYGGSVKAANASALFAMQDIDGGLVGGASLDANEFLAIAAA